MHRLRGAWGRIRAFGLAYAWARLRLRLAGKGGQQDYATWIALFDTPPRSRINRAIRSLPNRPRFSVLMPEWNEAASRSLYEQAYPDWQLLTPSPLPPSVTDARIKRVAIPPDCTCVENALLAQASGDFVAVLAPGDILAPSALFHLARAAGAQTDLMYGDEDQMIADTRCAPLFRSAYCPELLYHPAGLGHFVAWRRGAELFRAEAGPLAVYDMVLRVAERASAPISHTPHILIHRTVPLTYDAALWEDLLNAHLARIRDSARAIPASETSVRVSRPVPAPPPKISIIIPTRNRAELLARCVADVTSRTDYPNLEVLVIDNDSTEADALHLLDQLAQTPGIRLLRAPGPFNFSAMNNLGAGEASGDVLALLNNDVAVRHPDWLREMVGHALCPEIGAVGAKLLYENGTIQHAGVTTGIGAVAGHLYRGAPDTQMLQMRSVGAVTAACMVLRRDVFLAVGGFDAAELPVSYNDVDLCLRLRARGLRIVFTPHAVLDHFESLSRGDDLHPEHLARARREAATMQRRWGAALANDPYYSPNLSLMSEQGGLAFPPRTRPL
jgi:GT2 family glycosyltransferase